MRRWVCIVALLAGFSADGAARARPARTPVPIERPLVPAAPGIAPTSAWWRRS